MPFPLPVGPRCCHLTSFNLLWLLIVLRGEAVAGLNDPRHLRPLLRSVPFPAKLNLGAKIRGCWGLSRGVVRCLCRAPSRPRGQIGLHLQPIVSDQTPRYVDGLLKRVAVPTRSSPAHLGKEFLVWGVRHQVEVVLLSFPVELSAEGIRAGEHSPLRRAESELLEGRPFGLVTMATWSCILQLQTPPLPRNVVNERPGLLPIPRRRRAQLERLAGTSFEGRPNVAQPPSRSRCGPLRGRHHGVLVIADFNAWMREPDTERERERERERGRNDSGLRLRIIRPDRCPWSCPP